MRLVSPVLVAFSVSIAACGGGDDGISLVIDAGPADAEPVPDAEPPPPCAADECDGVCVNFDVDETTCGDCDTQCVGGQACSSGVCACPPGFVPANPGFLFNQLTDQLPGAITGFGLYPNPGGGGFFNALGVAYPIDEAGLPTAVTGKDYILTGALEAPGIVAAYNVDIQASPPSADAVYAATEGTLTFDTLCDVGFTGTAADLVFQGINSLTDPTISEGACTFNVAALTFAYGDACP